MRTLSGWLEFISQQHSQTIDMGLGRMAQVVAQLDLTRPAQCVITVAGTNGKGSTCQMIETLLIAHGKRVGSTLSPHIQKFNERIRLQGQDCSDEQICQAFAAIEAARGETPLTYFEFAALAALWLFKQAQLDVAILEIGLGGRLDAFNVIDADIGVITSIGLDHQEYLGTTRSAIGAEKAGIFRAGQAIVLGEDMPQSVLSLAQEAAGSAQIVGEESSYNIVVESRSWSLSVMAKGGGETLDLDRLPLMGCPPHNATLACMTAGEVVRLEPEAVGQAIAEANIPGRLEEVAAVQRRWVLDVTHNPDGAAFLAQRLIQLGLRPRLIVCAMLDGKDHAGVYAALRKRFSVPWLLLESHGPRSLSAHSLATKLNHPDEVTVSSWEDVVADANTYTEPGDVILVFGSFSAVEQFKMIDFEQSSSMGNAR